jgi:hypothetical protein
MPLGLAQLSSPTQAAYNVWAMAFTSTSFHKLNDRDVVAEGRKGGQSRSRAKVTAARSNGVLGGRKPSRTLAERLLGRTLRTAAERAGFREAFEELLAREQQELVQFFGVESPNKRVPVLPKLRESMKWRPPFKGRARDRALNPTVSVLHTKEWRQRVRLVPREIRYLIRKLKLAATQFLPPVTRS